MISKKRKISITVITLILACLFVLSAKGVYAAIDEEEPNDDRATANMIEMGISVYGDIATSEQDWFKFTAPITGKVKLSVWTDAYTEKSYGGLTISVKDNKSESIDMMWASDEIGLSSSMTFPVQCGKTYYVTLDKDGGMLLSWGRYDYHLKVDYSIGKTSIKSVRGKSGAFTVNWSKKSKASFYQVQYVKKSVYEDYGWTKAKKLNVASSSGSKTIRNLAKNKAYYVRVRVARSIEGVTYYSPWSAKKKVQTK